MNPAYRDLNPASLSAETRLLALLAVNSPTEEQQRSMTELLSGPIDWERFRRLAVKNRVSSLVHRQLSLLAGEGMELTDAPAEQLADVVFPDRVETMAQTGELVRLMGGLERAGVRAVSLKGPLLGLALYGDPSLRPAKDLDILVAPEDLHKAEAFILGEGGRELLSMQGLSPRQMQFLRQDYEARHLTYITPSSITVELHWRYASGDGEAPFSEVWANRVEAQVCGQRMAVPGPEDNLLYLIRHGSEHGWKRLRWLCDVYELVLGDVDWSFILDKARQRRMCDLLGQTLLLLQGCFMLPEAMEWEKLTSNPRARRLAALALPFMDSELGECEEPSHPLYRRYRAYLWHWNGTVRDRFMMLGRLFRPGMQEFCAVKLPDRYFFLYWLIRPFYKLLRSSKALIHRLGPEKGRRTGM